MAEYCGEAMREKAPRYVVEDTRREHRRQREIEPQIGVAIAFAVYALAFLVLLRWQPFGGRTFLAVTDVQGFIPPFVAAGLAFMAGWAGERHVRHGWWCIAAGCLLWGFGDVIWTVYEVVLQQDPFPSLADAGYLALPPLFALGLVFLTSEQKRLAHSRPALDGIAFVLAGTALIWLVVLHPTYTQSDATGIEKAFGAAYPIGDLVVAYALAVATQTRWGRRDGIVLSALLAGMMVLIAADVGFAYLTLNARYTSTSLVNLGWPCAFLLIGYAAALGAVWPLAYDAGDREIEPRDWRIPIALSIVLVALGAVAASEHSWAVSLPVYAMVAVSAVCVAARVAINFGLGRDVEAQRERMIAWIIAHKSAA
jgi:hypothetical protein